MIDEEADAMVSALINERMKGAVSRPFPRWQPIETAPKDAE